MADATEVVITCDAGDHRRATALTCHYGRGNAEGINALMAEAVDLDRVMPLIMSVLGLHEQVVPILLSSDGVACLSVMVFQLTQDDNADPDCRRAARLIVAHSERDVAGFNQAVQEAYQLHRGTELLIGLFATYSTFVPVLYSELGLQVLERAVIDWAKMEEGGV